MSTWTDRPLPLMKNKTNEKALAVSNIRSFL
jgi:hypothetical protein